LPPPAARLTQSLPLPSSAAESKAAAAAAGLDDDDEEAADAAVAVAEQEEGLCSERAIGEIDRRLAALQDFLRQSQRGAGLGAGRWALSQSA